MINGEVELEIPMEIQNEYPIPNIYEDPETKKARDEKEEAERKAKEEREEAERKAKEEAE